MCFLISLISYINNPAKQTGFIPEVVKLLSEYDLSHVLYNYLDSGVFLPKASWIKLLKSNLDKSKLKYWKDGMTKDPSMASRVNDISPTLQQVNSVGRGTCTCRTQTA